MQMLCPSHFALKALPNTDEWGKMSIQKVLAGLYVKKTKVGASHLV